MVSGDEQEARSQGPHFGVSFSRMSCRSRRSGTYRYREKKLKNAHFHSRVVR